MMRWVSFFLVGASFFVTACGGGGSALRDPAPVVLSSGQPEHMVREAILRALPQRGWQVESEEQKRLVAVLHIRSHVARVLISYDPQTVWIQYVDSVNLDFRVGADGTRYIHPNYNRWVENLARDIQSSLSTNAQVPVIVVPVQ